MGGPGDLGVLYYVRSFPSLSESFVLNEIAELRRRGHDVAVFAWERPEERIVHEELEHLEVPVCYGSAEYRDGVQLLSKRALQVGASWRSVRAFGARRTALTAVLGKQCSECVEALDFDVDHVHAHFASPTRMGAVRAARYHGLPCTVTAHAAELFQSPDFGRLRALLDRVDHVVVPSAYNRRYLFEVVGVSNDVTVVPATTDLAKFEPAGEPVEHRLLTVARLVEKKGHEYAIDAVASLVERGYDVEYHVVGNGDREAPLRRRVARRGLEEHVTFLGHVSDDRLRTELGEASAFVLPCVVAADGDRDAMPVALKEAMAAETACVSTTVSAIPELITDGRDGLLVPPRDAEALAEVIQALFEDPDRRRELARNGRRTVESRFDISDSVDDLLAVFESCTGITDRRAERPSSGGRSRVPR